MNARESPITPTFDVCLVRYLFGLAGLHKLRVVFSNDALPHFVRLPAFPHHPKQKLQPATHINRGFPQCCLDVVTQGQSVPTTPEQCYIEIELRYVIAHDLKRFHPIVMAFVESYIDKRFVKDKLLSFQQNTFVLVDLEAICQLRFHRVYEWVDDQYLFPQ